MNSLGINKSKKDTKVVVAMSGGVDSSVVAALMKKEGYDVTGITLKLYDDAKTSTESRQCCAGQDILDAKRVSERLDIEDKILVLENGQIVQEGKHEDLVNTEGLYKQLHKMQFRT